MPKTEEERRAAELERYKKRDQNRVRFALNYMQSERNEGLRLKNYLEANGLSANSYIKALVKEDLDKKGIK